MMERCSVATVPRTKELKQRSGAKRESLRPFWEAVRDLYERHSFQRDWSLRPGALIEWAGGGGMECGVCIETVRSVGAMPSAAPSLDPSSSRSLAPSVPPSLCLAQRTEHTNSRSQFDHSLVGR